MNIIRHRSTCIFLLNVLASTRIGEVELYTMGGLPIKYLNESLYCYSTNLNKYHD